MQRIPYARHSVSKRDVNEVVKALESDTLAGGGPYVKKFEKLIKSRAFAGAVAVVNSGTAALHAALHEFVKPGDDVLVPTLSFCAAANMVKHLGARPIFVDCDPDTLCTSYEDAKNKLTVNTKAIVTVDYAGQHVDYASFYELANKKQITFISDACHSFGMFNYKKYPHYACYSFHPAKVITTGEGGAVAAFFYSNFTRVRQFISHGIDISAEQRDKMGLPSYDIRFPGYNYRMPEINAALGVSQMRDLNRRIKRRQEIAATYDLAFNGSNIRSLKQIAPNARHLYVVRVDMNDRYRVIQKLRAKGIMANIHYPLTHGTTAHFKLITEANCPNAEKAESEIITLPLHHKMTNKEVETVIQEVYTAIQNPF